jgi:ketosteroid isomerase-like protein
MGTQEALMTTQEIANRLSELFEQNDMTRIHDELFSDDAESIEPAKMPGNQTAKGREAIRAKGVQFNSLVEEMHGGYVGKPIVAGNHIAVAMGIDATMKGMGRSKMDEIVLYEVKDGKIVSEQFFF